MVRTSVGDLLKQWRVRRRRSQLDLSIDVGVSTRHLSFVETGRSRPSPELVLAIAHHLDVPLRERNTLLLAAGYAPRFSEAALDAPTMTRVRASLQRMLDAHDPYPGVAVDRQWNIVLANAAAAGLTFGIPDEVVGRIPNVYRLCLHPDGLAARTLNFPEWAGHLLDQLRRSVAATADPELASLLDEVLRYPNVAALGHRDRRSDRHGDGADERPELLVPFRAATPYGELSMFTTITTFGTPVDVTLDELAIELFYPADDESERLLRRLAETRTAAG